MALRLPLFNCRSRLRMASYLAHFLPVWKTLIKSCSMRMSSKFLLWPQGVRHSNPLRYVSATIELLRQILRQVPAQARGPILACCAALGDLAKDIAVL